MFGGILLHPLPNNIQNIQNAQPTKITSYRSYFFQQSGWRFGQILSHQSTIRTTATATLIILFTLQNTVKYHENTWNTIKHLKVGVGIHSQKLLMTWEDMGWLGWPHPATIAAIVVGFRHLRGVENPRFSQWLPAVDANDSSTNSRCFFCIYSRSLQHI